MKMLKVVKQQGSTRSLKNTFLGKTKGERVKLTLQSKNTRVLGNIRILSLLENHQLEREYYRILVKNIRLKNIRLKNIISSKMGFAV